MIFGIWPTVKLYKYMYTYIVTQGNGFSKTIRIVCYAPLYIDIVIILGSAYCTLPIYVDIIFPLICSIEYCWMFSDQCSMCDEYPILGDNCLLDMGWNWVLICHMIEWNDNLYDFIQHPSFVVSVSTISMKINQIVLIHRSKLRSPTTNEREL